MARSFSSSSVTPRGIYLLSCCVFIVLALISTILTQTTTTCSSLSCSTRGWLSDLQQEALILKNTVSKLEKAINVLNSTSSSNTTTQIITMRVAQLKKVRTALDSLNLEIQVITDKCDKYDGIDCNITRALNITGEFMYFNFDSGAVADKYGIPVLTNEISFSDVSPRKPYYGKYAVFDKTKRSTIDTNSNTWVTFGSGKSMTMWIRKLPNADSSIFWQFIMSNTPVWQHMGTSSNDVIEFWNRAANVRVSPTSKFLDNEWHHLAMVCKSNGVDLYVDGVLDSSSATPFATITNNIRFGDTGSSAFQGHMDEIRMFNVELTAAQVQQIYNY